MKNPNGSTGNVTKTAEGEKTGKALMIGAAGALLMLPSLVVLSSYEDITWLAWTTLVVGAVGLLLVPVTAVTAIKERGEGFSSVIGFLLVVFSVMFVMDTVNFLG